MTLSQNLQSRDAAGAALSLFSSLHAIRLGLIVLLLDDNGTTIDPYNLLCYVAAGVGVMNLLLLLISYSKNNDNDIINNDTKDKHSHSRRRRTSIRTSVGSTVGAFLFWCSLCVSYWVTKDRAVSSFLFFTLLLGWWLLTFRFEGKEQLQNKEEEEEHEGSEEVYALLV